MQGDGDADDLGGAVVGRDGLKAKGVAHNERLGSLEMSLVWRLWRRSLRHDGYMRTSLPGGRQIICRKIMCLSSK